jgi:chromosome segregation ATPase
MSIDVERQLAEQNLTVESLRSKLHDIEHEHESCDNERKSSSNRLVALHQRLLQLDEVHASLLSRHKILETEHNNQCPKQTETLRHHLANMEAAKSVVQQSLDNERLAHSTLRKSYDAAMDRAAANALRADENERRAHLNEQRAVDATIKWQQLLASSTSSA